MISLTINDRRFIKRQKYLINPGKIFFCCRMVKEIPCDKYKISL